MRKRSTKAVVDEVVMRDVAAIARGVPVEEATTRTARSAEVDALQDVVNMLPVNVGPAAALVRYEPVEVTDLRPIHAAAEAAGLKVTSLSMPGEFDGYRYVATCGPHVPPFTGATVAEVLAKIAGYNCKHCGTGGGHTPNCGRPRT